MSNTHATMPPTRPKRSRTSTSSSRASHRSQAAPEKTEITINVYDLLPPGRLSTLLWTLGTSLLHSGVVINNHEYAYGGHNRRNLTGVYWTPPRLEPPGGTFRASILQGFTFRSEKEMDAIIREVSERFLGTQYNLLECNCNHFTSALVEGLTGRSAPGWLNRAAGVGVALPCVVPKEWVQAPDYETADGELLDEDEDEEEEAGMLLASERRRRHREALRHGSLGGSRGTPPPRLVALKDTGGREMPVAERAPVPKKI
ncbi:hypothetical protein LTR37_006516 [Vermiconidia calcicola]|uniref:Uncharacterized protein n=1 Tax=Vermiconidia calcicola TaxID=1690605 RepID=A0ACC3NG18_9PEZI|nr:hypothetical protein LTR37_006516 [Vermiconidia calcicola]